MNTGNFLLNFLHGIFIAMLAARNGLFLLSVFLNLILNPVPCSGFLFRSSASMKIRQNASMPVYSGRAMKRHVAYKVAIEMKTPSSLITQAGEVKLSVYKYFLLWFRDCKIVSVFYRTNTSIIKNCAKTTLAYLIQ